jgi:integrase
VDSTAPIERKSDWHAWKRLLADAGVRDVRLHDGRHTAATLLLSEGVHPRVVMEVLGHAQMRTITDTYSHVMPALGRDAAEAHGQGAVGLTRHRCGSSGHHAGTRNESGRSPSGRTA